jgi:hypothetical protein
VSDFHSASDAGVALVSPVLFRQTELLYALFSAAMPALNQYLRKFDTRNATHFGYHPNQYGQSRGNYEMSNMSNNNRNAFSKGGGNMTANSGTGDSEREVSTAATAIKSSGADFRPAGYNQYQVRVDGPTGGKNNNDGISGVSQEDGSVGTGRHGSEEHIIRKEVVYDVRRE